MYNKMCHSSHGILSLFLENSHLITEIHRITNLCLEINPGLSKLPQMLLILEGLKFSQKHPCRIYRHLTPGLEVPFPSLKRWVECGRSLSFSPPGLATSPSLMFVFLNIIVSTSGNFL